MENTMIGTPMRFRWTGTGEQVFRLLMNVTNRVNSHPWMGKAPGTCKIADFKISGTLGETQAGYLIVEHRPNWKLQVLDRDKKLGLLDGRGNPLPPGEPPVFLEFTAHEEIDFNQYHFGELLSEGAIDPANPQPEK